MHSIWYMLLEIISLIAHASKSWSLHALFRLIVEYDKELCTKMPTPPYVRLCLQCEAPNVYLLMCILIISDSLRWCSVRQSKWGGCLVHCVVNSSILLCSPLIFWWYICNLSNLLPLVECWLVVPGWSRFVFVTFGVGKENIGSLVK